MNDTLNDQLLEYGRQRMDEDAVLTLDEVLERTPTVRPISDKSSSTAGWWIAAAAAASIMVVIGVVGLLTSSTSPSESPADTSPSVTTSTLPTTTITDAEASLVEFSTPASVSVVDMQLDGWATTSGSFDDSMGVINDVWHAGPHFLGTTDPWLHTSQDGVTFTIVDEVPTPSSEDLEFGENGIEAGLFWSIATSDCDPSDGTRCESLLRSTDAVTWTAVDMPEATTFDAFHGSGKMIRVGETLVIRGSENMNLEWGPSGGPAILVSTDDGHTWKAIQPFNAPRTLAVGWTGSEFFAVAHVGQSGLSVAYSADGVEWSEASNPLVSDPSASYLIHGVVGVLGDRTLIGVHDHKGLRVFQYSRTGNDGPVLTEIHQIPRQIAQPIVGDGVVSYAFGSEQGFTWVLANTEPAGDFSLSKSISSRDGQSWGVTSFVGFDVVVDRLYAYDAVGSLAERYTIEFDELASLVP